VVYIDMTSCSSELSGMTGCSGSSLFLLKGGWGREWLLRKVIMSYITGPDPEPKPGWKERLKEGEVNITAVENFNKANHVGIL
jgi:hypothetical protein